MNLEVASQDQIATTFGLMTSAGQASRRGLAEILRSFSLRQGMVTRRRLLRYGREQIAAAGLSDAFPSGSVGPILDRLVAYKDYQHASIGHQPYALPGLPRWIEIGAGRAALVGLSHIPKSLTLWTADDCNDLVRRCEIGREETYAALRLAGFIAISWDEWLQPLDYVKYVARRSDEPIRSDLVTLSTFWDLLTESLAREGHLLGPDAEVRFLTGKRGGFFGRRDSLECEGRWSTEANEGVWCAYRKGFGDAQWHPAIVAVDAEERRCFDLFDHDEWAWALLAKAESEGQHEVVKRSKDRLSVSFPMPEQLSAAMDLLGHQTKSWEWDVAADAPDIWALVR